MSVSTISINSNPYPADLEPPGCFDSLLFSMACQDSSNITLKITASIFGCVLNGLQHHSCALWQRHAVHAKAFPGRWWKLEPERVLSQNSTGFWVESVIKTYSWPCCTLAIAIYGPVSRVPSVQTDETARAPLLQLVCLESLQQLGANDLQTDSPAGFACLQLCFLCLC